VTGAKVLSLRAEKKLARIYDYNYGGGGRDEDWERHQRYVREYEEMLATRTPAQLAELKKLGLDKPVSYDLLRGRPRLIDGEEEFDDPADDAVDLRHPIAELNQAEPGPELLGGEEDLAKITEAFAQALAWAGQAKSLVDMGWRFHAMLQVMRPALLEGMELEVKMELAKDLVGAMEADRELLSQVGERYQRVLAWIRRCGSLSAMGQRGFAAVYLIRRGAIGARTNAQLGAMSNKTRQAFNKLVQDCADWLGGFRNEVMRREKTRIKCRMAQIFGS
jgi:hypothetical protein